VYTTLFGIGKLVFGETMTGLILLAVAVAAFAWIARSFREESALPSRRSTSYISEVSGGT